MWFRKSLQKTTKPSTRARGMQVERQAEAWLCGEGLSPLERNYTIRDGELDLIMREGDVLVFIEVRYRKTETHGSGAESVDPRKQKRLQKAAQHYLQAHFGNREPPCRFDVMSVSGTPMHFEWIRNAF